MLIPSFLKRKPSSSKVQTMFPDEIFVDITTLSKSELSLYRRRLIHQCQIISNRRGITLETYSTLLVSAAAEKLGRQHSKYFALTVLLGLYSLIITIILAAPEISLAVPEIIKWVKTGTFG